MNRRKFLAGGLAALAVGPVAAKAFKHQTPYFCAADFGVDDYTVITICSPDNLRGVWQMKLVDGRYSVDWSTGPLFFEASAAPSELV